ncbi:hypothetical protein E4U28_000118, partial [Claviceps purpurea]
GLSQHWADAFRGASFRYGNRQRLWHIPEISRSVRAPNRCLKVLISGFESSTIVATRRLRSPVPE